MSASPELDRAPSQRVARCAIPIPTLYGRAGLVLLCPFETRRVDVCQRRRARSACAARSRLGPTERTSRGPSDTTPTEASTGAVASRPTASGTARPGPPPAARRRCGGRRPGRRDRRGSPGPRPPGRGGPGNPSGRPRGSPSRTARRRRARGPRRPRRSSGVPWLDVIGKSARHPSPNRAANTRACACGVVRPSFRTSSSPPLGGRDVRHCRCPRDRAEWRTFG